MEICLYICTPLLKSVKLLGVSGCKIRGHDAMSKEEMPKLATCWCAPTAQPILQPLNIEMKWLKPEWLSSQECLIWYSHHAFLHAAPPNVQIDHYRSCDLSKKIGIKYYRVDGRVTSKTTIWSIMVYMFLCSHTCPAPSLHGCPERLVTGGGRYPPCCHGDGAGP